MCGIIAIVGRSTDRTPPTPDQIHGCLRDVQTELDRALADPSAVIDAVAVAAARLEDLDRSLRGLPGVLALGEPSVGVADLRGGLDDAWDVIDRLESGLDSGTIDVGPDQVEEANSVIVRVRDALWSVRNDRLRTAHEVWRLAGRDAPTSALAAMVSVQAALSAIDRLEVRGRDSAGLHVMVRGHGLDVDGAEFRAMAADRLADPLFGSQAVRVAGTALSFVYKAAAEIGDLGDNTASIRKAIAGDQLLARALASPQARVTVLGHTRWASVGIISEANAHPLNSDEEGVTRDLPYVIGALNGDVDNYADLKVAEALRIRPEISTDAKVIPTLVARSIEAGDDPVQAFRSTVSRLDGSVAIAASATTGPDAGQGELMLALRGSGQALYVGVADEAFVVASEPYGVVELTSSYLRLDGETPSDPANVTGSRGQIVVLDPERAGELDGIHRFSYDGTVLPVTSSDLTHAEITTRDIDRGDAPHYLLKELSEAPGSFRKTLRGHIREDDGQLVVELGPEALPPALLAGLADGTIRRVRVIGQGTAAVAGRAVAHAISQAVGDRLMVDALPATELSGFHLTADMRDTLVVAISQSGTTTDTNRTVDLARGRKATVVAIVNRRGSDLTDKADGVLYTSDGRDVEMSVASTKAFYSQIAAGLLLAVALADALDVPLDGARQDLLQDLRSLPEAMTQVLAQRERIASIAAAHAPSRQHWAIVGNGANFVAAHEIRIKLSELCYKSIACDVTEDKKHIDLSAEPLILVCAAGLSGSTAEDVAKEVAIYRAHKAAPIVIAGEGEARFEAAVDVIRVPTTHPDLAFILSAMAGHIFGYEAARAIDAQAIPLRMCRATIETRLSRGADIDLESLGRELAPAATEFLDGIRRGAYDGHLEPQTAVKLSSLFRYVLGTASLDGYSLEHGKVGTPSVAVEDLVAALNQGIEELTRPIDAIKHQAKTVTVGISRSDEGLLQVPLVAEVLAAGAPRDRLSYGVLRTIAALDRAVDAVTGYTRYRIDDPVTDENPAMHVIDKGGIARDLTSRVEREPLLRGTKHRAAFEREVTVARGRSDGRTVIIVPEAKGNTATGLTLLHCTFTSRLPAGAFRSVLEGYRGRYAALRDAVTETEPRMRDDILAELDVVDVLVVPVHVLAEHWRSG